MTFFFHLHLPFVLYCFWFELVSVNGLFFSSLPIVSHRDEDLRVCFLLSSRSPNIVLASFLISM